MSLAMSLGSRHAFAATLRAPKRVGTNRARPAMRVVPRASALNERIIQDANAAFSIPGSVVFEEGKGGLPVCKLTHKNGGTAEVYLFGACVTSWCQPSGDEVLFVRPDAVWDKSKPISGGIPICFPRFGPSPEMQQHGFARNVDWVVCSSSADPNPDDPEPSVMFKLKDNDYTREMWDVGFEATYEVTLRRDKLKIEFCVRNPPGAEKPIDFTAAVHTYIEVVDAASPECLVRGLKGKRYIDKAIDTDNLAPEPCAGDVTFGTGLIDRVFQETEPEALLHVGTGAAVSVENTRGWTDTVVWNPHETLDKEGTWKKFVCVESAAISSKVTLDPEKVWRAETNLCVIDL